jgi:branched-chain amino acid aminotransferase
MFIVEYDKGIGWHDARIVPYGPLCLDPASPIFHYAQEVFEGTKVYRLSDGNVGSFRLRDNARRMNRSADRTCMPEMDEDFQIEAITRLVDLDRDWVPSSKGTSLYIRPTMISDGNSLGAHSADRFIYFVICAPSGSYYPEGMKPVRIRIEQRYVRAVRGGMGRAKTGGNYAASFKATKEAMDAGFNQVLWLDGREQKYVEEVGAMNMMFVIDGKIVTAELGDTILPGVTRDSVITLARERGMVVEERRISVQELYEAHAKGQLSEAFGTGTAAVISPVGELQYMGESIIINNREIGPMAQMFYDALTALHRQTVEDTHGWTAVIPRYEY